MPLAPKRVIHRKVQRGKIKGNATRGNTIDFEINRRGQVWIRVFPDKPISKKPAETRMGKGKGAPEFWAAVIKPGQILFEIGGVDLAVAAEAMQLAGSKLPIKTKIAYRPTIS